MEDDGAPLSPNMLHEGYDGVMTTLSSIEMFVWSYLGHD